MVLAAILSGFGLSLTAPWLHRIGRNASGWLLALLPLGLFLYFLSLVPSVVAGDVLRVSYPWVPSLGINLSFVVDGLGLLFALLITGIGALVVVYAGGYLAGHPQLGRFYAFLLLFMAAMLGLVLADNLIALFVFWELTSISSYLLIGFKHGAEKSRKAALQALIVTGLGGLALLAGVILLAQVGGSQDLSVLSTQRAAIQAHPLYGATLAMLLLAAFTKSAQFPFHFWLPGAMEAPAPVSSYLHSATMVKAGVYLLARLSPAMGGTAAWQITLTVVGGVTLLVGAVLAVQQTDMKRLLAYTTVAALGMLTLLIGVGTEYALIAAMMFLLAHALYKGALFMAAGAVDHETGTRDVQQLGGLRHHMPITWAAAGVAAWSMAGLPSAGFIGKELAYAALLDAPLWTAVVTSVAVLGNILMGAVAGLVWLKPFFGAQVEMPHAPHEAPLSMWLGPVLLAALGLFTGLLPSMAQAMVLPAATATIGAPYEYTIKLWPGINVALGLSVLTVAAAVALYLARDTVRRTTAAITSALPGPERGYNLLFDGTLSFARTQTRVLQSGYLRVYLLIIIATLVGLAGFVLAQRVDTFAALLPRDVRIYEWLLAGAILAGALVMVRASSRLAAVAALGVVGYGVALIFLLYSGPDLAMTQFAIETLSVILFVLVLYRLPRFIKFSRLGARLRDAVVALTAGGLMTALVLATVATPLRSQVAQFYAENSATAAFGRNIVNVILVDFRSFDTLGEITVLAVAAIGVYALIALRPVWSDERQEVVVEPTTPSDEQPLISLILSTMTRAVLPLMLVFSGVLLLRGHNEPGGGFVGGLVYAAAFALYAIANGRAAAQRALYVEPRTLIGVGLLLAVLSGLLASLAGLPFLAGLWYADPVPVIGKVGTPLLFDVGVYLTVAGVALTMIFALAEE